MDLLEDVHKQSHPIAVFALLLSPEKKSETRMIASGLKQDPNT